MNMGIDDSVLPCCGAQEHPWDTYLVATEWSPDTLRYFIIGESPGEEETKYFYNPHRTVAVRTIMLRELHRHRLLNEPTLQGFRKAGFLFDHVIRCILSVDIVKNEANLANRYQSPRAATATHLKSYLRMESPVWVMGRIARNAVAILGCDFPRDTSEISKPPYPCRIANAPRFFVSRYLLHASRTEIATIFACLHAFCDENSAAQCVACHNII
jgi:hypothetical protein